MFPGHKANDTVLWVESQNAVISGDTLVDFGQDLEINERWLRPGVTREEIAEGSTDFGSNSDEAFAVAVQPDGNIVAAGRSGSGFALARYHLDGSLDSSFGSDGLVAGVGVAHGTACALALQPDRRIVVAGRSREHRPAPSVRRSGRRRRSA